MAAEKHAFELKANVNSVELWIAGRDKALRLEQGDRYETGDPEEIAALSGHDHVKTAEGKAGKE